MAFCRGIVGKGLNGHPGEGSVLKGAVRMTREGECQGMQDRLSVDFPPVWDSRTLARCRVVPQQVDIDRISFIAAARWLAAARDEEPLPLLVINLHRPYRYEPRVRKRRPKQYPLMQTPRQELRKLLADNTDVD